MFFAALVAKLVGPLVAEVLHSLLEKQAVQD